MGYQNVELALIKTVYETDYRTNKRTHRYFKTHEEMMGILNGFAMEKLDLQSRIQKGQKRERITTTGTKVVSYAMDAFTVGMIAATFAANPALTPMALIVGGVLFAVTIGNTVVKLSDDTGLSNKILESVIENEKTRNTISTVSKIASTIFSTVTAGICALFNPFKSALSSIYNIIGKVVSGIFGATQAGLHGTKGIVNFDIQKLNKKLTLIQGDEKNLEFNLKSHENALQIDITHKNTVLKITVFIFNNYLTPPKRRR